ncbi:MAG: glycosyltransferase family A protein [Bacteroidota bacterium]
MKVRPLVTVICLCHNHETYVSQAIESVFEQTYSNIELIVADDASSDNSKQEIQKKLQNHPEAQFISLHENIGNCAAFNLALQRASGEYVIDLAADDVLLEDRVQLGVQAFKEKDRSFGINFTNAELIDESDRLLKTFYEVDALGRSLIEIPEGDIFQKVIQSYFICAPTTMYAREVLEELGGYDETLTYEDFDFWIRSSRKYKYCYTDKVLVKKRILRNSKSKEQFRFFSKHTRSTLTVLKKAARLVVSEGEKSALRSRLRYEMRKALERGQFQYFFKYFALYAELSSAVILALHHTYVAMIS